VDAPVIVRSGGAAAVDAHAGGEGGEGEVHSAGTGTTSCVPCVVVGAAAAVAAPVVSKRSPFGDAHPVITKFDKAALAAAAGPRRPITRAPAARTAEWSVPFPASRPVEDAGGPALRFGNYKISVSKDGGKRQVGQQTTLQVNLSASIGESFEHNCKELEAAGPAIWGPDGIDRLRAVFDGHAYLETHNNCANADSSKGVVNVQATFRLGECFGQRAHRVHPKYEWVISVNVHITAAASSDRGLDTCRTVSAVVAAHLDAELTRLVADVRHLWEGRIRLRDRVRAEAGAGAGCVIVAERIPPSAPGPGRDGAAPIEYIH
jgi:hypothetical protein